MKRTSQLFWRSFDQAWDSHDAEAVAAHFEEDGVFVFIDGRLFSGKNAVIGFYRDAFSSMPRDFVHRASVDDETNPIVTGSVEILGASKAPAVMTARYHLELSPRGLASRLTLKETEPNQQPHVTPISRGSAPHYKWAEICDGWRLVDRADLSVIEEKVPAGAREVRHYHERARQFFYVLKGDAVLEIEGQDYALTAGAGIEVQPGQRHQFFNRSDRDVAFLVVSTPSTRDDRHV